MTGDGQWASVYQPDLEQNVFPDNGTFPTLHQTLGLASKLQTPIPDRLDPSIIAANECLNPRKYPWSCTNCKYDTQVVKIQVRGVLF